jgi:hypothetical protein
MTLNWADRFPPFSFTLTSPVLTLRTISTPGANGLPKASSIGVLAGCGGGAKTVVALRASAMMAPSINTRIFDSRNISNCFYLTHLFDWLVIRFQQIRTGTRASTTLVESPGVSVPGARAIGQ